MKYTSEYINSISFSEYIKLMADELNSNGFKYGRRKYIPFEDDPAMRRLFMMGPVNDPRAMAFLKEKGLIENGRCPQCGAPMSVYKYYWYDMRDPTKSFSVCYGCSKSKGHGDGHSMDGTPYGIPNKSQLGTGCIVSLLLLPFYLIKSSILNIL